jgi:hypothetical protein
MEDVKVILGEAADLIEKHGWVRCVYGNPEVGFCAAGAIWYAITGVPRGQLVRGPANDTFMAALELLPCGSGGVAAWNDNPRTTKDDVIRTLREAAA